MAKYDFLSDRETGPDCGFRSGPRGTHSSRTIMLNELSLVTTGEGLSGDIRKAILEDNVLGKSTSSGRTLTLQRLKELYCFDRSVPIFNVFAGLAQRDPAALPQSVKVGEQILLAQARHLVGDRDPRAEEYTLQLRAIDADKSGGGLGVAVLVALCGSLLGRNSRGGTIVVGSASLGGSIELVPNAVQIAELAIEKQAQTLLMPVSARRQLHDLPDELWTKIGIEFYKDPADAVFKALVE